MAGQHNLHNHQIAVKFPHQVWRQIEIDAEKRGEAKKIAKQLQEELA